MTMVVSRPGRQRGEQRATVDGMLSRARARIGRISPADAFEAAIHGDLLIDIRSESQCAAGGYVPVSIRVERNVLEWRADPSCEFRDPRIGVPEQKVVVICQEGYQSSLAAAALCEFGLEASDVIGGFLAWKQARLPVTTRPPIGPWLPSNDFMHAIGKLPSLTEADEMVGELDQRPTSSRDILSGIVRGNGHQ